MFDAKDLLNKLVRSGAAGGFVGGLAGGALTNAVGGKKTKKLAGSALKVGGLALVGGLAYKAWQSYRDGAGKSAGAGFEAPPARGAFLPAADDAESTNFLSLLLARAMISAAKADGQIDTRQSQTILNQVNALDIPAEQKQFLFEEYGRPLDIKALAADVDSKEHATEVYAASVLMVDPPSAPEQIYLDTLARELGLEAGLVQEIHKNVTANRLS